MTQLPHVGVITDLPAADAGRPAPAGRWVQCWVPDGMAVWLGPGLPGQAATASVAQSTTRGHDPDGGDSPGPPPGGAPATGLAAHADVRGDQLGAAADDRRGDGAPLGEADASVTAAPCADRGQATAAAAMGGPSAASSSASRGAATGAALAGALPASVLPKTPEFPKIPEFPKFHDEREEVSSDEKCDDYPCVDEPEQFMCVRDWLSEVDRHGTSVLPFFPDAETENENGNYQQEAIKLKIGMKMQWQHAVKVASRLAQRAGVQATGIELNVLTSEGLAAVPISDKAKLVDVIRGLPGDAGVLILPKAVQTT